MSNVFLLATLSFDILRF